MASNKIKLNFQRQTEKKYRDRDNREKGIIILTEKTHHEKYLQREKEIEKILNERETEAIKNHPSFFRGKRKQKRKEIANLWF